MEGPVSPEEYTMELHHVPLSVSFRRIAFPELKYDVFPPQRGGDMTKAVNRGVLPDGVTVEDLPTWRPSGIAVVVKYHYVLTDVGVIRKFVSVAYVGAAEVTRLLAA